MPLDNTTNLVTASNSTVRLPPKLVPLVKDYINARALVKRLNSEAAAADSQMKALRQQIREAMVGAPSAVCGKAVLTHKQGKPVPASLTLSDGSKLPWASVTAIVAGRDKIAADKIASLYGGRSGSDDIDVSGTP